MRCFFDDWKQEILIFKTIIKLHHESLKLDVNYFQEYVFWSAQNSFIFIVAYNGLLSYLGTTMAYVMPFQYTVEPQ